MIASKSTWFSMASLNKILDKVFDEDSFFTAVSRKKYLPKINAQVAPSDAAKTHHTVPQIGPKSRADITANINPGSAKKLVASAILTRYIHTERA